MLSSLETTAAMCSDVLAGKRETPKGLRVWQKQGQQKGTD